MKTWKKIVLALAAVPLLVIAFSAAYLIRHSMSPAKPFTVNGPEARDHVLVATQGSAYKDAVVQGVTARLGARGAYVSVVDVGALGDVREAEWSAIVVIHTWEGGKPPPVVKAFVDRVSARDKLVVLTTSGDGDKHMDGVDAITSASALANAPSHADEIARRVEKLLTPSGPKT